MLKFKKYRLDIVFTAPLLGTQPGANTPASDFIRNKVKEENPNANIADEVPTLPEELEKGTTGFPRNAEGKPILFNYQVKGCFKNAGKILNGSHNFKGLESKITDLLTVIPRQIVINTDKPITFLERPLRAQTMQGPRVSLVRSEMIAEGATATCEIEVQETTKVNFPDELIMDLVSQIERAGFLQWRNSGTYGQAKITVTVL